MAKQVLESPVPQGFTPYVLPPNERLIRLPEVLNRTGLSKSGIYQKIAQGGFPAPRKPSRMTSCWLESEISAWIDGLSRKGA